jgi:two-component system, cell cycle response regulator DivK
MTGAERPGGSVRVVYVEDDCDNAYALTRRLGRRGFDVVVAGDGAAGIEEVRKSRPDLVLMDMSLPVLDGWEATRRLKADPATRDIPVIGLSSHAMTGDREAALSAGCDDYDTKPIELERLLAKIDTVLSRGTPP